MADGDLRKIFKSHLSRFHCQAIETPMTGGGVPDLNYAFNGGEGWCEMKKTLGWAIKFDKEGLQVAWLDRRARLGCRVWIAVRQLHKASPRRPACDTLWMFGGSSAKALRDDGLKATGVLSHTFPYGPNNWDWEQISWLLRQG